MSFLSRPWSTPYHPARAYLLPKGLFALLATDVWLTRIPVAFQYGFGGFNAAHFTWIDRLLPSPTPTLYIGFALLAGMLSIKFVVGRRTRWETVVLTAVCTLLWAASVLDGYQHHYLLSWLLAWCVLIPEVSPERASKPSARVWGPGFPMVAITCSLVYFFTAITKSESDWRAGKVLASLFGIQPGAAHPPAVLQWLASFRTEVHNWFGPPADSFWLGMAYSAILLQIMLVIGYVLASERDAVRSRARSILFALALGGSLAFYLFLELSGRLSIGLFSYYMMWVSFVVLAPVPWVARLAVLLGRIGKALTHALVSSDEVQTQPLIPLLKAVAASGLLVFVGTLAQIPGARWATGLWAAATLLMAVFYLLRRQFFEAQRISTAAAASAGLLWLAMAMSPFQYDYFVRSAEVMYESGQYEAARAALLTAKGIGGDGSADTGLEAVDAKLEQASRAKR